MCRILFLVLFLLCYVNVHRVNAQNTDDDKLIFPDDGDKDLERFGKIIERISKRKCTEYSNCVVPNLPPSIVGGNFVSKGTYPHMTAIGINDTSTGNIKWICGGSLISELYILTAAHCIRGDPLVARLGTISLIENEESLQQISVESYTLHPSYAPPASYHDIALLKLSSPVKINNDARPACLQQTFYPDFLEGNAAGWGVLAHGDTAGSNDLMEAVLKFHNQSDCIRMMGSSRKLKVGIQDGQMCAGAYNKDTCQGDSGGPLMTQSTEFWCMYHIVGITSFGKSCGVTEYAVYTRVYSYLDWIESVVWPDN